MKEASESEDTQITYTASFEKMARERQTLIVLLILSDNYGVRLPGVKYGHDTRNGVDMMT